MPKNSKGPGFFKELVRTAGSIARQQIGYNAGKRGEPMDHAYTIMPKDKRDEYAKGHARGTLVRLISDD